MNQCQAMEQAIIDDLVLEIVEILTTLKSLHYFNETKYDLYQLYFKTSCEVKGDIIWNGKNCQIKQYRQEKHHSYINSAGVSYLQDGY